MKILIISDKVSTHLYDNFNRENFKDISFVIGCGDLPRYYLDFVIDALNVPCFFVPGNHDEALYENPPAGWVDLHRKIVKHNGLTLAGLGGSPFYNGQSPYQFTERQMAGMLFKLRAKLLWKNPIDIFVTHSPASGLGDIPESRTHGGYKCFHKILDIHKPKLFTYGHVHLNYGVNNGQIYNNILLANAYDHQIIDWTKVMREMQPERQNPV